jgi:serine/threonine protein kinase
MFCQRCGTEIPDASSFCNSCGLDVTSIGGVSPPPKEENAPEEIDVVREALKEEYDIIRELGRGGMAVVFHALEKELDREVAVKVLPASMGFDAEFVERFQREARTAAKLEHPSIIPIYRVGKSEGVIYFVMKFLRGKSLADIVDSGPLDTMELRRVLSETASALGYAHKHQIVHRDIKPDNILLDDTGRAIVTDFGIAKAATGAKLTGTGMAIGTPHYMSPEQAKATPLDGRSDIYSLGVCAYQCLTGKVPFDGTDAFSIGYKHITEDPPEPELETDDQRSLFEIIKRMMQKNPDDRFQTAEQLCLALDGRGSVMEPQTVSTRPTTPIRASSAQLLATAAEAAASVTPTTPMPSADFQLPAPEKAKIEEKKKSRGGIAIAAALLVVLGGGGGGGYLYYKNFFDAGANPAVARNANPAGPLEPGTPADGGQGTDPGAAGSDSTIVAPEDSSVVPPTPPDAPTAGVLILTGMPSSAQVQVDGNDMRGGTYELGPGSHSVFVRARGRVDFRRTVDVTLGDTTTLRVRLARIEPVVEEVAPNCAQPGEGYNTDQVCFDVPPAALDAPLVPLTDDVQGTPAPVVLLVQVGTDGSAMSVNPIAAPADPAFFALAVAYAQQMGYNPAQKDGRPVVGWFQLQLSPFPR